MSLTLITSPLPSPGVPLRRAVRGEGRTGGLPLHQPVRLPGHPAPLDAPAGGTDGAHN